MSKKFTITILSAILMVFAALSGSAQTLDTSASNQLTISNAVLDGGHCPQGLIGNENANPNAFDNKIKTLTIKGINFNTGQSAPMVLLGNSDNPTGLAMLLPTVYDGDKTITATINCKDVSPLGSYRLLASTGTGKPFNDGITMSFSNKGNNGKDGINGNNGVDGKDGAPGQNGKDGNNGVDGKDGAPGQNGKDGKNGRGFSKRVVPPSDPTWPALADQYGCNNGAIFLIDTLNENGEVTSTDGLCHGRKGDKGDNGNNGANGKDGAPGQNGINGKDGAPGQNGKDGKNGVAKGWYKKFDNASINATSSNVLSQEVTGANNYVINAKLNVPFGNGAKSVICSLIAVENGITFPIDSTEANLQGSNNFTAKGVIALSGVYTATGSNTSNVTISATCGTGGDTRTLNKGALNIVGTDTVNQ